MTKYFYAIGLHKDGGLNILNRFLNLANENDKFLIDERLKNRITYKNCSYYSNNIFNLFYILLNLKKKLKPNDHLIFLNGLPPIFKYKCDISIIFQNANLFREFYKINIIKWLFSKDSLRYLNFIIGKKNVDNWYVFSPVAKKMLELKLKKYFNLKIINFYNNLNLDYSYEKKKKKFDFIYPASLMDHKNHDLLIKCLIKLADEKIFPSVLLTLNNKEKIKFNFNYKIKKYNLNLYNYFEEDQNKFVEVYKKCSGLLYLSKNETIGLPLLEAINYKLFIIAPDLVYAKQFIKPNITFNINSVNDLCNSIKSSLKSNFEKKERQQIYFHPNSITINELIFKIL